MSITLFLFFQQVSTCREGKLGGFSLSFCCPSGVGLRVWPFLVLAFSDFLFEMGSSGFLSRSIDVKLGVFPDKPSDSDVAKSLWDFFNEAAQFKVVAIQRCPNRIARVTFEVGGEAVLSDFLEGETILVRGVECEVTFPAPRWKTFLYTTSLMRRMIGK